MIESRPVAAWVWRKVNRESGEEQQGGITKRHEKTFGCSPSWFWWWFQGHIHFDIYISKLENYILDICVCQLFCNSNRIKKKSQRGRESGKEEGKKGKKRGREGMRERGRLATWVNKPHDNLPGKLTHQHNLREVRTRSPKCSHFIFILPPSPNGNRVRVGVMQLHLPETILSTLHVLCHLIFTMYYLLLLALYK